VLADIPQPVEDKADIVVPLSLLRSANSVLPRSFADAPTARRTAVPSESSGTPLPKTSERRSFVCLFFEVAQSSNCAPEMRIDNSVIRSASSVSQVSGCWAVVTPNTALQPYG
jgi:hypothetical protein